MTHEYRFKVCAANGRACYEYSADALIWVERNELERHGQPAGIKKDFPFPESLLKLLYLDVWSLEPLTKKIEKALLNLYRTKEEQYAQEVLGYLDELASAHIYLELLRLDWRYRLQKARREQYEHAFDQLPRKRITHIPSIVDRMQRQIIALFDKALNLESGKKKSVSEKMVEYYNAEGGDTLNTFQFRPQPMNFEVLGRKTFAEVLYPNDIYDLIDYHLRECVKREARLKVCKNCGRYFAITGRSSAEYCDRVCDEKGRTCKDVGAIALWTMKRSEDEVFKVYRREYKKRFAWIKSGKIAPGLFYAWSEKAREKKAECEAGNITLKEFSEWLSQL